MTDEEKKDKLDISDETKEQVKLVAKEFGKEYKEAAEKFKEIFTNPVVEKQKDSEELAVRMLRGAFSAEFGRPTQEYEFYVAQKTMPREMPRKDSKTETIRISNCYGFAVNKNEADAGVRYASVAHFDKEADLVNAIVEGKMYKVRLSGGLEGNVLKLSATDITKYVELDETPEEFKEPIEVVRKIFARTDIAEGISKVGDKLHYVEGTISNVALVPLKGRAGRLGLVTIVDDSLTSKDIQEMGGGLTIMVDPVQVKYGQLSVVGILGNFTHHDQYGLGMNGQMILPIVAFDFEPPKEDVSTEDAGLSGENADETVVDIEDEDLL